MHFSGLRSLSHELGQFQPYGIYGRVHAIEGLIIEVTGPIYMFQIGSRLTLEIPSGEPVLAEVIGFREERAICMPFGSTIGIGPGVKARLIGLRSTVSPSDEWLGRVLNGLAKPIDDLGPLAPGKTSYDLKASPPPASKRDRVGEPIDLGVRSMNTFTTCCKGQRLGIFSGSGVGKSYLMSMLARNTDCDVCVIGLIGERGREVNEFLHEVLGEEGLKRSIVIVATSDEPPLVRRQAAYLTLTIAEYFRNQGKDVLCMMDSVTRIALAQREIGLSAGEPPTTRGYTPSVFSELPKLLERAGPGVKGGSITGLFSVLVDGDNHNEPVADAVRGILDGHIVMERAIAERGRFPAINPLKSISRTMPNSTDPNYRDVVSAARKHMTIYSDMEELIRLGAYKRGSNAEVDEAIRLQPELETFLKQDKDEATSLIEGYRRLAEILGVQESEAAQAA